MIIDIGSYIRQVLPPTWRKPVKIGLARVLFRPIGRVLDAFVEYEREATFRAGLTGQKKILENYLQNTVEGGIYLQDEDGVRLDFSVIIPVLITPEQRARVLQVVRDYRLASKRFELRDVFAVVVPPAPDPSGLQWAAGFPRIQEGRVFWAVNRTGTFQTRLRRVGGNVDLISEMRPHTANIPFVSEVLPTETANYEIKVGGLVETLQYLPNRVCDLAFWDARPAGAAVVVELLAVGQRRVKAWVVSQSPNIFPYRMTVAEANTGTIVARVETSDNPIVLDIPSGVQGGAYSVLVKDKDNCQTELREITLPQVGAPPAYVVSLGTPARQGGSWPFNWEVGITETSRGVRAYKFVFRTNALSMLFERTVTIDTNASPFFRFEPAQNGITAAGLYTVEVEVSVGGTVYRSGHVNFQLVAADLPTVVPPASNAAVLSLNGSEWNGNNSYVHLKWTYPTNGGATGFALEYKDNANGIWQNEGTAIGAATRNLRIGPAWAGYPSWYRLRVIAPTGNTYSNEVAMSASYIQDANGTGGGGGGPILPPTDPPAAVHKTIAILNNWDGPVDAPVYSNGAAPTNGYWRNSPNEAPAAANLSVTGWPYMTNRVTAFRTMGLDSFSAKIEWELSHYANQYDFRIYVWLLQYAQAAGMKIAPWLCVYRNAYVCNGPWSCELSDIEIDASGTRHETPYGQGTIAWGSPKWNNVYNWVRAFCRAILPYKNSLLYITGAVSGTLEWEFDGNRSGASHPDTIAAWNAWYALQGWGGAPAIGTNNALNNARRAKFYGYIKNKVWGDIAQIVKTELGADVKVLLHAGSFTNNVIARGNVVAVAQANVNLLDGLKHNPDWFYDPAFATRVLGKGAYGVVEETFNSNLNVAQFADRVRADIDNGADGISFSFLDDPNPASSSYVFLAAVKANLEVTGHWTKGVQPASSPLNTQVIEMLASVAIANGGDYEAAYIGAFNASKNANGGVAPVVRFIDDLGGAVLPPVVNTTEPADPNANVWMQVDRDNIVARFRFGSMSGTYNVVVKRNGLVLSTQNNIAVTGGDYIQVSIPALDRAGTELVYEITGANAQNVTYFIPTPVYFEAEPEAGNYYDGLIKIRITKNFNSNRYVIQDIGSNDGMNPHYHLNGMGAIVGGQPNTRVLSDKPKPAMRSIQVVKMLFDAQVTNINTNGWRTYYDNPRTRSELAVAEFWIKTAANQPYQPF